LNVLASWFDCTHSSLGDGVEEDGVRWDVVRSDLCHALGEVIHNGALSRDLHAAKDRLMIVAVSVERV